MADDGSLKAGLKVLAEPFELYFKALAEPQSLVDSLWSGRITPATLMRFMLASIVLATAIEAVLPGRDPVSVASNSFVSDLLTLAMWLVLNVALIALVHKPLTWLGRPAPFRLAAMAALFLSAMFYPFFALAEGVYFLATANAFPPQAMAISFLWTAQSLARLYRTTSAKAGGLLIGAALLLGVPTIVVLEKFGPSLFGPTVHTVETLTPVVRQSILDYWASKPEWQDAKMDTLLIAPPDSDNKYRGLIEGRHGTTKVTWDLVVEVNGEDIQWRISRRQK